MRKQLSKNSILKFGRNAFLNAKRLNKKSDNILLESALHYANLGCPVFPVHSIVRENNILRCSCRNWKECDRQGKHPRTRHGLNDASNDKSIVREWWTKYPNANIGLLTGKQSGFFVLDIDVKYGGEFTLEYLQDFYQDELGQNYAPIPGTLTAKTGSGGRHIFFKYPKDISIKGSVQAIGAGLDIRSDGNYVVASPSNHFSGNSYSWLGMNTPVLAAPDWLIISIIEAEKPEKSIKLPAENISVNSLKPNDTKIIKDGEGRWEAIWRYICKVINYRTEEEVLKLALQFNSERIEPPKSESYVRQQVKSLYRKYGKEGSQDMGLKK